MEKEKKDKYLQKLRNDMGLNNIQSKLMDINKVEINNGIKTDTVKI